MTDLAEMARLAAAAQQAGDWDRAEPAYRRILELAPQNVEVRRALARLLAARGQPMPALDELRRAIELAPHVAGLYNDQGMILARLGRAGEAQASFERALQHNSDLWQARYNLGNAHLRQGHFAEAAACYQQALASAPKDFGLHLNLSVAQKELGDHADARRSIERAMQLSPNHPDAWLNLGTICRAEGDLPGAIDCFRRAAQLKPDHCNAHWQLGKACLQAKDVDGTLEAFTHVMRLDPLNVEAYLRVGSAQAALGDAETARNTFAEGARRTGAFELALRRTLTLPMMIDSRAQVDHWRRRLIDELAELAAAVEPVEDPVNAVGGPPFPLAYHGANELDFQKRFADLMRRASPAITFVAPHCASPTVRGRGQRIHVGFVSAHLHNHTIGKLNAGLVGLLDRERFFVTVFRRPTVDDDQSRRIAGLADACVTLESPLARAQAQIAEREPDVLFYTDIGMEPFTYYLAHARLAGVQCATWGHPVTTGIPTVDYFISSQHLEVAGADAHYSEKLVRLAHLANYYLLPAPPSSKSRAELGLPAEGRLYGCPQSIFKLHPDDDEVLGEILRRDPSGHLVLLHSKHAQWSELLCARLRRTLGGAAERVHFLGRLLPPDFSRLLEIVDALVDPLHFGGGDTSYQSFAVGAPVVTLPSQFLRGRITYALYRALGVEELIAVDRGQYVELALRLARDRGWREDLSGRILAAGEQIFLSAAGVRDLEAFFEQAVATARH